jgi:hypothetical protein
MESKPIHLKDPSKFQPMNIVKVILMQQDQSHQVLVASQEAIPYNHHIMSKEGHHRPSLEMHLLCLIIIILQADQALSTMVLRRLPLHQTILIIQIMRLIIILHLMLDLLLHLLVSHPTAIIGREHLWRIDQALPVLLNNINHLLQVIIVQILQSQDLKLHHPNLSEKKVQGRLCLLSVIENGMRNLDRPKAREVKRSDQG